MKIVVCVILSWAVISFAVNAGRQSSNAERFDFVTYFIDHYAQEIP